MNYLKLSIFIFFIIALSRFIPHPPNFTSLVALSYYAPALLGISFMPAVVLSFALTDVFLGFHETLFFTWGSVVLIGFLGKYLKNSFIKRILGASISTIVFFVFTNFGVWISGLYSLNFSGLLTAYILAIPFFINTAISTLLFSLLIECGLSIYKFYKQKLNFS